MEKYEPMGVVGEGSYGIVLKCKSRNDGKVVAIKKFIDSEDDVNVRKIAMREIRVLKKLRHENLVSLIEVFRRRKHLYLVFEFIDHTLLDQMEQTNHGLDPETCRKYIFQILRGLGFCHDNSVIHRDIKPENVLVSKNGIVKLCDFGFARNLSGPGDIYTDYVATRWYRAPELLVGDVAYGKEVDIWAVGCLFAEMMTGEPLFPGDSDIDQLFLIAQCLGRLSKRHLNIMSKNSAFRGFQFPKSRHGSTTSIGSTKFSSKMNENGVTKSGRSSGVYSSHMNSSSSGRNRNNNNADPAQEPAVRSVFSVLFPSWSEEAVYFLTVCLDPEPNARPTCNSLMRMPYFSHDGFPARFLAELNAKLQLEGRQTTASHHIVRKRRSLVPTGNVGAVFPGFRAGGGGPNVTSTIITPSERSSIFPNSRNASIEEPSQKSNNPRPFQSNNLSNQTHFSNSTNLSRQQTFLVGQVAKNPLLTSNLKKASGIPVLLHRKSSDDSFPINSNNGVSKTISSEEIANNKEKRQTPKKFSFSVNQPENSSDPKQHGHLPVTTLTFNLGPHNMTFNGTTYTTSTAPTPLKSPGIGSTPTNNDFSTSMGNRSSPSRSRKKVGGLGNIPQGQGSNYFPSNSNYAGGNNPRSLPLGVSVFGAPIVKNDGNGWNNSSTPTRGNGESFLPRVTSKHLSSNVSFDENTPMAASGSPSKPGTGVNPLGRKREKWEQPTQPTFQNRKVSISNSNDLGLGNIRAFLNSNTNEGTAPSTPLKNNQFKF